MEQSRELGERDDRMEKDSLLSPFPSSLVLPLTALLSVRELKGDVTRLTRRFATTILSATQSRNVGTIGSIVATML